VAVAAVGLVGWTALRGAAGLPPGTWKIGLDMPLTGDSAFRGVPMRNAVMLAIDQANAAGGTGGAQVALVAYDDRSPTNPQDDATGAANASAMVADPGIFAMVGPASSQVATSQIPITNRAGLLQCSPSNSRPGLTKPRDGALDLRAAFPTRINYVRTAPSDDIQGPALASFIYSDLAVKRTLVIDDTDQGRDIADAFSAAFGKLGGTVVRRAMNPGADPASVLEALSAPSDAPTAVFFGGFTHTGAPELRAAMVAGGHASLPFVSWDGIQDGSGADEGSFIALAGAAAAGSYFSHATIGVPKADFTALYRAKFGADPDEYAAAAYACTQVILASLRAAATMGPSAETLRDVVRGYAVDPSRRFETVIGTVGFDANGDSLQQFVTFYKVDMSAAGGKGDWVVDMQQDYGPAP
jgi:branched-chain amino acid transport system substrate-binding protein